MKKLLVFLLAVTMLFCLCSCGNDIGKSDAKDDTLTAAKLEGAWEMSMDIGTLLESGAIEDMSEALEMVDIDKLDLELKMDVSFKDGKLTFDPQGMADFYKNMINAMLDWLKEGDNIYELMAQSSGMTMTAEQYKATLEAQGMTKDALIDLIKDQMPDTDSALEEMEDELDDVCYELVGDKLYTWNLDDEKSEDEYFQFTYLNKTITVNKVVSDGDTIELSGGSFVFTKK